MPPPLSDTNFVDEGSLIGIRQTEERSQNMELEKAKESRVPFKISRCFKDNNIEKILSEDHICNSPHSH